MFDLGFSVENTNLGFSVGYVLCASYVHPQKKAGAHMRTYLVSARMHLVSTGSQDTYMCIRMYQGYYVKTNVGVEVRRHKLRGPLDFDLFSLEQHQFS